MNAAWEQVGDVLEANARIRAAQLGREVADAWHAEQLAPLACGAAPRAVTLLTAPVQARVMSGQVTAAHEVAKSSMPAAPLVAATRRMLRPGGRVARHLEASGAAAAGPCGRSRSGRRRAPAAEPERPARPPPSPPRSRSASPTAT